MYINTGVEYPPHWCRRQIQAKAPPEDVVGQAAIRLGLVVVSPRFKTESKEEDVKTIVMQVIKATGMKEKHVVDYPAIPITHVLVEFGDTRTRDRFVRSANMRKYDLDGRRIKISPALEPDEKFDRKRLGYVKCVLHREKEIALHWINMNLQRKTITINGQTVVMIDASGQLRYNRYEDIEKEVQKLMETWLTKNS